MASFEILSTEVPEYDPSRTTGDPIERTALIVEWSVKPTQQNLRRFEEKYPPQHYSTFHFVEGEGMVRAT